MLLRLKTYLAKCANGNRERQKNIFKGVHTGDEILSSPSGAKVGFPVYAEAFPVRRYYEIRFRE